MKQSFFCFFCFLSSTAYSVALPDQNLPKDHVMVLQARVTDVYGWSENNQKYSLKSSQFAFKVFPESEGADEESLLGKDSILDVPKRDVRYLSVYSSSMVHFESVKPLSGESKKTMAVRAMLSEDKEKLSVFFPEKTKKNILEGLLLATKVESFSKQNIHTSSNYDCQIENKQLICSIKYILKKPLKLGDVNEEATKA